MKSLLAAVVAICVSSVAFAQTPAPSPQPLTPTQIQINEVKARLAIYRRNLAAFEASIAASKGLIATDEATLATLESSEKPVNNKTVTGPIGPQPSFLGSSSGSKK